MRAHRPSHPWVATAHCPTGRARRTPIGVRDPQHSRGSLGAPPRERSAALPEACEAVSAAAGAIIIWTARVWGRVGMRGVRRTVGGRGRASAWEAAGAGEVGNWAAGRRRH